jgi:phosphoglycolate phosphatase
MPTHACAIFDLDGTLIDSREDLATGINLTRHDFGLPPLSLTTVVSYIGEGVRKLCERSFKDTGIALEETLPHMKAHYRAHFLDQTHLYPGVEEGLQTLHERGYQLTVLTNKPQDATNTILAGLKIDHLFRKIIGGGGDFAMKPDPEALLYLMREIGSEPQHTYMVGDHYTDMEAGRRAGCIRAYAAWGFGNLHEEKFDIKAESFADLVRQFPA